MGNFDALEWRNHKVEYQLARIYLECVKDMAYEIEKEVLEFNEFYECMEMATMNIRFGGDGKPQRIFDPHDSYKIGPDTESFQRYLELCYEGYKEAGIDDPRGVGYCHDNAARTEYYKAEKKMIDYALNNIIPDIHEDQRIDKAVLRQGIRNAQYKERFLKILLEMQI